MTIAIQAPKAYTARRVLVLVLLAGAFCALGGRAVQLQALNKDFLKDQGAARHLRVVTLPAHRGMILDRNGEPLAISTPVDSVWVNPQELGPAREYQAPLAQLMGMDIEELQRLLASRMEREFVYLQRHVEPTLAERIRTLNAPGVYLQREYRRYYPGGEVTAHVLGFTNVDDVGQEGMELAYDEWLRGEPGAKRVIKDGRHNIIKNIENIKSPRPGRDLVLSIDRRVQYLAYRELKAAVQQHRARGGSIVVMDADRGEVLAMVNQPSFNPNNRKQINGAPLRNRGVTDVFEPGSTLKVFTIAAALESGKYKPETPIETSPGTYRVGTSTVRDVRNFGLLDVAGVIRKSSNVGASKIALTLPPKDLWTLLSGVGFGETTGSNFPGEAAGLLSHYRRWRSVEVSTLAFGYGISVTPLQLAQSYSVLAADGYRRPVSFLRQDEPPAGTRVMPPQIAQQVRAMLESVVGPEGTAQKAQVHGYRVGGKTGTVRKSIAGGYADNRYLALFVGMAPMEHPSLVALVMLDEPQGSEYYGGQVAAPVFSRVMSGTLRLMNMPPDAVPLLYTHAVPAGGQT